MGKVSEGITIFQRKRFDRVVMSGHGAWWSTDGQITVPVGITIHFYVAHGDLTNNAVGMAVENRFASDSPPSPVETLKAGDRCHNYRLSFGSRLTLNGSLATYKYDWITVNDVDRQVPLSVLLRDARCESPCEIHWAACREIKTDSIAKNGRYITRNNLSTAGKDLSLQDETGATVTHNVKMPGRIAIPKVFGG
jgi:hypothetical protein